MSFQKINNFKCGNEVFLQCLSKFYESELTEPESVRKQQLRDSIVKAYNKAYKTKVKGKQLIERLRLVECTFQPYEWQKLFLDVFENEETLVTPTTPGPIKSRNNRKSMCVSPKMPKLNAEDLTPKKEKPVAVMNEHQEAVGNIPQNNLNEVFEQKLQNPEEVSENYSETSKGVDYKSMSVYQLKRALLVSKLEMLDAQEAVKRAKENIKLTEQEFSKRQFCM